jgi:hypothetical protein
MLFRSYRDLFVFAANFTIYRDWVDSPRLPFLTIFPWTHRLFSLSGEAVWDAPPTKMDRIPADVSEVDFDGDIGGNNNSSCGGAEPLCGDGVRLVECLAGQFGECGLGGLPLVTIQCPHE